MRRKWIVLLLGLVALAIGGAAAFVVSSPLVRARYHLRFASSQEVRPEATLDYDQRTLTGHALAFAADPAAKELLPDLCDLANGESDRDAEVCHRALLLVVGAQSSDEPVLRAIARMLESRSALVREATLAKLPGDLRLLDAVLRYWERLVAGVHGESPDEVKAVAMWLSDLEVPRETDQDLWQTILSAARFGSYLPGRDLAGRSRDWLERHRAELPRQIVR